MTSHAPRPFDIVIYGATGFTGERVFYLALQTCTGSLAVAGRSESRLRDLLAKAATRVPEAEATGALARVGVVVADVGDSTSLEAMARKARVIINCVGPFRDFGPPVVKAAIAGGADYLDVSGEICTFVLAFFQKTRPKRLPFVFFF